MTVNTDTDEVLDEVENAMKSVLDEFRSARTHIEEIEGNLESEKEFNEEVIQTAKDLIERHKLEEGACLIGDFKWEETRKLAEALKK